MKPQRPFAVSLLVSMALPLAVSPRVYAGPDLPTVNILYGTATFTGDQSNGIWPASSWTSPPIFTFNVHGLTTDVTPAPGAPGIEILSQGAGGGNGGGSIWGDGGAGGAGEFGGGLVFVPAFPFIKIVGPTVNFTGGAYDVVTSGTSAYGISARSVGGNGGSGGWATPALGVGPAFGGDGGAGGLGATVTVASDGDIRASGNLSYGILAESRGGNGGGGGWAASSTYSEGGTGGPGGGGGKVDVFSNGSINTAGESSPGILARSQAGDGGGGGDAGAIVGEGGSGGIGGTGGRVHVVSSSLINTTGASADGISAQSLGGEGGNGGTGGGLVGVGGGARGSGPGGAVVVENSGAIATSGADSRGIFSQSVGGFAGGAGTGGGVLGWGGSGNSAGNGGTVGVTNNGMITVTGGSAQTGVDKELVSAAIFAQSVGGGGGDAAGSGGLVALGGKGSAGGSGDTVNVENNGRLQTSGNDTYGIIAQSIGGGGGSGGASYGLGAVGGAGSSTGNGNAVYVTNTGAITTAGDGSAGILAQSVGGGGGVVAGHGGNPYSPIFTYGGSGGSGGNGGTVSVTNTGNLGTSGVSSSGIFAQSVGGGGGTGGTSYDVGLGFAMSLGGNSAGGGAGQAVDVVSTGASILTTGDLSHGIQAQSVGGGGGNGGNANSYTAGAVFTGNVAIGGFGGGGGDGGLVDLTSASQITTHGEHAHGLYAESVGGGGGSGGNTTAWTVGTFVPGVDLPTFTFGFSVGGKAGEGGSGQAVTIDSAGDISTSASHSYGILAQSVGGGGGYGGNSTANTVAINSWNSTISVGGEGGKGGSGRAVQVTSAGNIATAGDFAYGMLGQSIGGGGGAGGNSTSLVADAELVMSLQDLVPSGDFMANTSIGGSGDGGGDGGSVDVSNTGNIVTEGSFASGILAQSIGGGGGAGGDSREIQVEISSNPMDSLGFFGALGVTSELSVGGSGGTGGDAGAVIVHNSGKVTAAGDFAHGILAQSIGGGGGVGGDSTQVSVTFLEMPTEFSFPFLPTTSSVILGGSGGEGGNGGDLVVHNSGDIITEGHFANGILAQSIGGGGGANGSTTVKSFGPMSGLQSSMSLRGNNNGVGDGGAVIVENSANITTHGGFAHGILAQSIGGGGGFAGISEDSGSSTLDFSSETGILLQNMGFGVGFAGSVGGSGNAGPVSVTHTGSITTYGDTAHGILAQSAAGHNGTVGPVTVTLASEITTHGVDSDGIHAQSVGGSGSGNITINNGGTIRGGSGAGAGVNIDGGANNILTNNGSISALSGKAIVGSGGNDSIINHGTVAGSVQLGGGINGFLNNPGARFDTGLTIDFGAGNALTNAGILSPGGQGAILSTTLIGNLLQLQSGILEIDIGGFTPGLSDFIDITGTLTGELDASALPLGTGSVRFSLLPGYDIFADIAPGQSLVLPFLSVQGNPDFLSTSLFSYEFSGGPSGFEFNVFRLGEGLYFEAENVVPAPGACLLAFLGLSAAGWRLRKPVRESARTSKIAESLSNEPTRALVCENL